LDARNGRENGGSLDRERVVTRGAEAPSGCPMAMAPPLADSWTPESAWTALRVEAARVTVWSSVNSAAREVETFMWK